MRRLRGSDVERAAAGMLSALSPHGGRDWTVRAGSLEWSCWTTAAHVAHDLFAYAAQVADLSALVLARLFPDAPAAGPRPDALLWSAGRAALPDRPRRTSWSWQAALPQDG